MTAQLVKGSTYHRRLGHTRNSFRYGVDYLLVTPEELRPKMLLGRNRPSLFSLYDRDNGGERGNGSGAAWARQVLDEAGFSGSCDCKVELLTQPRCLGFWFCPVSFWLASVDNELRAVIAEVNNTFGDRHSYLCAKDDFGPIYRGDQMKARKIFHVSPFQDVSGDYRFSFDVTARSVSIHILLRDGQNGVIATLQGTRKPLTNRALLGSALRRPAGAIRVLALIYWQAIRLKLKGVSYRRRPAPPAHEVSR
ncbi:DUF1365 domain-containing protein [Qingshengfaniella alkalisoli]|uniref:DUF1365 domain-containing protein n=1 Tax=Qingshengfaniella alkalisoli TaxID=2599296 RepID=A0A5B8J7Y9_9RHOB|nr:DUF1365 domain-containing protein [Qingshengfaniella alkalisoli]QDY70597.1 DUF1365 domain-containing protein [Qingshengfaniella alkalisoli]